MKTTRQLSVNTFGSELFNAVRSISGVIAVCAVIVVTINVMVSGQASYITKVTEAIIEASK